MPLDSIHVYRLIAKLLIFVGRTVSDTTQYWLFVHNIVILINSCA